MELSRTGHGAPRPCRVILFLFCHRGLVSSPKESRPWNSQLTWHTGGPSPPSLLPGSCPPQDAQLPVAADPPRLPTQAQAAWPLPWAPAQKPVPPISKATVGPRGGRSLSRLSSSSPAPLSQISIQPVTWDNSELAMRARPLDAVLEGGVVEPGTGAGQAGGESAGGCSGRPELRDGRPWHTGGPARSPAWEDVGRGLQAETGRRLHLRIESGESAGQIDTPWGPGGHRLRVHSGRPRAVYESRAVGAQGLCPGPGRCPLLSRSLELAGLGVEGHCGHEGTRCWEPPPPVPIPAAKPQLRPLEAQPGTPAWRGSSNHAGEAPPNQGSPALGMVREEGSAQSVSGRSAGRGHISASTGSPRTSGAEAQQPPAV